MSDGMMDDLEFREKIDGMDDRALLRFVAWNAYRCEQRICALEGKNKTAATIGGVIGAIVASAVSAVAWFVK